MWAVPPGEPAPPARAAPGAAPQPPRGLVMRERPVPVPEFGFTDAEGRPLGPADFRGRIVLLNIWATWCVPCREEMPALDRLQAELGSPDFEVVALSIDRGGADAVRAFYEQIGIANLAVFLDRPNASSRALGVVGIPTTLLIDRDGREIGRAIGPLEWDSPETVGVIRRAMAAAPSRS
nr:TlpA disulfide reductase family protein [Roseicella aerolata]